MWAKRDSVHYRWRSASDRLRAHVCPSRERIRAWPRQACHGEYAIVWIDAGHHSTVNGRLESIALRAEVFVTSAVTSTERAQAP